MITTTSKYVAELLNPESFEGLLERLLKRDPEFIKRNWDSGTYQIRLNDYWMVVSANNPDDFDFMRLDRAIRSRINERGWKYGLGIMSGVVLNSQLARIYIPGNDDLNPMMPRALWIWESHSTEDAIAILRAYVKAVETISESKNADTTEAA
jgi:hypothetical protein